LPGLLFYGSLVIQSTGGDAVRLMFAFALLMPLVAMPAAEAQSGKSKETQARTYLDGLDMSSGLAVTQGFIDAFGASDYFRAYFLLSPEAKQSFLNTINSFNVAQLLPAVAGSLGPTGSFLDSSVAQDIMQDTLVDGATLFDDLMVTAEKSGALPFDLDNSGPPSATIDQETQARFIVATQGTPGAVIISALRLSNGDWRVDRIVWAASDPEARPWGVQ
jgi:hypothetical protein